MPHYDNELIRNSIVGNFESFGLLVTRYHKQVFNLSYRLVGNKTEAEDMTQETFLNVYNNLSRFNQNLRFSSWVFRIATNVCFSHLRKKGRFTMLQFQEEIFFGPHIDDNDPADLYEQKERCEQVRMAIRRLPVKYQLVLLLKYMNELSYKEIAETLQISVQDVETSLYRGRKMLAMMLSVNFKEKKCVK